MPPAHSAPEIDRPSDWLQRWLPMLPASGNVLDFACGHGRNTLLALNNGHTVLAVDRDRSAVEAVDRRAETRVVDLETGPWPFGGRQFDAVVVCNYLFRPRLDLLSALVAPGGVLLYETFMAGNEAYGRPANPEFLLRPGELLALAGRSGLTVLAFEQGYQERPRPAMRQRICALRAPIRWTAAALG